MFAAHGQFLVVVDLDIRTVGDMGGFTCLQFLNAGNSHGGEGGNARKGEGEFLSLCHEVFYKYEK